MTFVAQVLSSTPLIQPLPGNVTPPAKRMNLLEDCFMLQRQNQTWIGIGYCVRINDANGRLWLPESGPGQLGVGSLFRWSASTNVLMNNGIASDPSQLYVQFKAAAMAGSAAISNHICDGVIHFYLQTSATNGFPIFSDGDITHTNAYFRTNALATVSYSLVHPAKTVANTSY